MAGDKELKEIIVGIVIAIIVAALGFIFNSVIDLNVKTAVTKEKQRQIENSTIYLKEDTKENKNEIKENRKMIINLKSRQ